MNWVLVLINPPEIELQILDTKHERRKSRWSRLIAAVWTAGTLILKIV